MISGEGDAPPLTRRSARALAGAIRRGEVSARDVVEAHIEVLMRWQPKVNAIAVERFDAARAEQTLLTRGSLPPPATMSCRRRWERRARSRRS